MEILKEETGIIKISEEVVAVISGICVADIDGIGGMSSSFAGGLAEMLGGKKNVTKGVKVEIKDCDVSVDLHIIVVYGARIPVVACQVQEKVKKAIEDMTGLNVLKINVHVDGIVFEKEKKESIANDDLATDEPTDIEETVAVEETIEEDAQE